jgi:hypothetical protein
MMAAANGRQFVLHRAGGTRNRDKGQRMRNVLMAGPSRKRRGETENNEKTALSMLIREADGENPP